MRTIDLLAYSDSSQRIPAALLTSVSKARPVEFWKIAAANLLDLFIVISATTFTEFFLNYSTSVFYTASMGRAFGLNSTAFFWTTLPILTLSYFCFLFFMNHGQTLGMLKQKIRLQITERSLKESFKQGITSSFHCFSFGIILFWANRKEYQFHDYLYTGLMKERDLIGLDLLTEIDKNNSQQEEEFKIAA